MSLVAFYDATSGILSPLFTRAHRGVKKTFFLSDKLAVFLVFISLFFLSRENTPLTPLERGMMYGLK